MICEYEYAGFVYKIVDEDGTVTATPIAEQPPAAYKDRHCRAAIECYQDDKKIDERRKK